MPRRQPHVLAKRRSCRYCRVQAAAWLAAAGMLGAGTASRAWAQFSPGPIELSGSVNLDQADSAVRAHLERVRAYVTDGQWDEAVETLRQIMENHGARMIPLVPARYVNLADYCHVQLASLPAEALALYRQRVDPLAEQWYQEGLGRRNTARLADVVEKLFCSSWGDDALWALGEIELERSNYGAARRYWERLIEVPPARIAAARFEAVRQQANLPAGEAALLDKWYAMDSTASGQFYQLRGDEILPDEISATLVRFWKNQRLPLTRLAYPGKTLRSADVRARLILVSIMEGSLQRAREELGAFAELHPGAEGRLAGRDVKYADALKALITAAENWPDVKPTEDWPTFAGDLGRNKISPRNLDLGVQAWDPINLGEPLSADVSNSRAYSLRRIGEDAQRLLSYHPLIVGDLVLVCDQGRIFAFNSKTGAPAWPRDDPKRPPGEIFSDDNAALAGRTSGRLGVPRFTMTVHDNKLYARMGSQVTSRPLESLDVRMNGYLVCLDLSAQGRLVWKMSLEKSDDEKWAFEGSPIVDGSDLYVAMRKSDVRPQAHVACFDAQTKRLRWRTMVCAAETPSGGQSEEITHNLLTLEQGTLYYNTNLGAVAAISARDGRLQWATLYRRAKKAGPDGQDKRTAHFYRDLNPCVYHRGTLFVAPSDCESIFALDAGSGEMLWESHLPEDAVHLLGVGHDTLIASGDALWWIDARRGKIVKRWPDTSPLGHGRGILMGDQVIWPTASEFYILDQDAAAPAAKMRDPIALTQRGAGGGNLVASGDLLLIATADKLFGFRQQGQRPKAAGAAVALDQRSTSGPTPRTSTIKEP
jgi:outer membrane protein assembly factor BamB